MISFNSDYYTLDNGVQAVHYIVEHHLGFYRGNCFKYIVRNSRKPGNSSEQDLNKALHYIVNSDQEYSLASRLLLRLYNLYKFNFKTQFASRNIADILYAIIRFDDYKKIAKMIIKYMKLNNVPVHEEFKKYE